jgi:hypothetical protein
VVDKPKNRAKGPKKGKVKVLKKAIVVLCVLAVLALLAVPILAEGLSAGGELSRQMSPEPVAPGIRRAAEKEKNLQMSPAPRPGARRAAEAPTPAQIA